MLLVIVLKLSLVISCVIVVGVRLIEVVSVGLGVNGVWLLCELCVVWVICLIRLMCIVCFLSGWKLVLICVLGLLWRSMVVLLCGGIIILFWIVISV